MLVRVLAGLTTLALASALAACPGIEKKSAPQAKCERQFEKCKLPSGPLGVCDYDKEKRLRCMPQH